MALLHWMCGGGYLMIGWVSTSIVPFSYDVDVVKWMCCGCALYLGGISLGDMT
jgi:hypothetical protein